MNSGPGEAVEDLRADELLLEVLVPKQAVGEGQNLAEEARAEVYVRGDLPDRDQPWDDRDQVGHLSRKVECVESHKKSPRLALCDPCIRFEDDPIQDCRDEEEVGGGLGAAAHFEKQD